MKTRKAISILIMAVSISFFVLNLQAQSKTVLSTYLDVKDALVATNSLDASKVAKELASVLNDKSDELSKKMLIEAKAISSSNDVKVQRKHFEALSQNVYAYVKKTGEKQGTIYKQFCPMAFNNTGAYWLAAEKEINNPYFRSMMLRCGSVKEEL